MDARTHYRYLQELGATDAEKAEMRKRWARQDRISRWLTWSVILLLLLGSIVVGVVKFLAWWRIAFGA